MAVQGAHQRIHTVVTSWSGVSAQPHRFGGTEFSYCQTLCTKIPSPNKIRITSMDRDYYVQCIIEGMELYLRTLALADNMYYQPGDVEWISPLPNAVGPALVYKIALNEKTAVNRIDALLPGVKTRIVPSLWFISPTATPRNIVDILTSKGFKDLSDPQKPELGMALDMDMSPVWPTSISGVEMCKVQSPSEFSSWVDVVNEALHGWAMLSTEHYVPLISRAGLSFYLAFLNGIPIATAASFQKGEKASLEFVSTIRKYRHQGVVTAICAEALRELQRENVKTVTLRASYEAIPLYVKLGFRPYFETMAMSYPKN
jgi:ribosomal protein S18 acetylase RimI-like enzyme